MDIAKIRKKAREKELKASQRREEAAEERGPSEDRGAVPEVHERSDVSEAEAGEQARLPLPAAAAPVVTEVVSEEADLELQETEQPPEVEQNILELLTFVLAEKEFAFRLADVEEIIPFQGITFVPLLPDYVSGIMSLRGKIVPVIDLRSRFALGQRPHRLSSAADPEMEARKEKILILAGPRGLIGATVDRVRGVVRFPEGSVLAPPAHLTEEEKKFIEGVVIQEKRFISVVRFEETVNIEVG